MDWLASLAWVGAGISLWGTMRYMASIAQGNTQPRLASWIAWGTANGVLMYVAIAHTMHTAAIFNGIAALGNVGVLVLSAIKRAGERPNGVTDWTCLVASALCLGAILCMPGMAILDAILAMSANVIATWPTIQHAWQKPREEAWQLFAANGGANALGLVSVFASAGASLTNIAGPLISMTGNVSLVLITAGRSWLTRTVHDVEETAEEVLVGMAEEVEVLREAINDTVDETLDVVDTLAAPKATNGAQERKRRLIRTY